MSDEYSPVYISSLSELQTICPRCEFNFSRPRDLRRHLDEVHGPPKSCISGCHYSANRRGRLQKHLIDVHKFSEIEAKSFASCKPKVPSTPKASTQDHAASQHRDSQDPSTPKNNNQTNSQHSGSNSDPRSTDTDDTDFGYDNDTSAVEKNGQSYMDLLKDGMDEYSWEY